MLHLRVLSDLRSILGLMLFFSLALALPAAAQVGIPPVSPAPNQFAPFVAPTYELDNVQGEIVNLEPQLIEPILITSDDRFVVVANDPDNRVVVLDPALGAIIAEIPVGQGIVAIAERPTFAPVDDGQLPGSDDADTAPQTPQRIRGEIWVSLRHQNAVVVINSSTWRVTNVLRPPITTTGQGAGSAATPGGIAFNDSGTKAYVAASSTDELLVYNTAAKTFLGAIALSRSHNGANVRQNDPMAVVSARGSIWVASHLSGNQTIVDAPGATLPGTFGPNNVIITDLVASGSSLRLPDLDIVQVNATTDTVVSHISDVGTVLYGIDAHPNGSLVVANLEAQNGTFIGEASFPNGQVTFNRLTYATTAGPNTHVTTENLGGAGTHIVQPTDVLVDNTGQVFVAGYASSNIGVFNGAGTFLGSITSPLGPRGLAYSARLNRLYSLNAAASSVSWYDLSGGLPAGPTTTFSLTDPTFLDVWFGRQIFLDPTNSGMGTTGCFSCHPDLRKDGLGWDLSAYFDVGSGFTNASPPSFWKDRKGIMVTQDLRSLPDAAPYHWRGEQKDLEDFNGAFEELLHSNKLSDFEFSLMKNFMFSSVYPPNPFQPMNRTYSSVAGRGLFHYLNTNSDGIGPCETCHALPSGTDDSITEGLIGLPGSPIAMKTAQLRGMWTKLSDLTDIDPSGVTNTYPSTGFGFAHEGVFDTFAEFNTFFFTGSLGAAGVTEVTQLLDEFDSGLAPCTAWSERLDMVTVGASQVGTYLIPQADLLHCDAVAKGRLFISGAWQNVGLVWSPPPTNAWVPDLTTLGNFTWPALQAMAAAGQAELLVLGVPHWSGERIGVDRDRDGVFDGDEGTLGTNATNPDTDGDGLWDSYDPQPLVTGHPLPAGAPGVVPGSVKIWRTPAGVSTGFANAIKITYETDTFSPTYVEFGPTTSYGFLTGDFFPLTTGPGTTNLWKRRHTAFIRPQPSQNLIALDDGALFNFRIITLGQNNVFGGSSNFTANTRADALSPNGRVGNIQLTGTRAGAIVNWAATVTVVDNNGATVPAGIQVTGRFTHYQGAVVAGQSTPTGLTNASGQVTFNTSFTQSVGDDTVFDIPMTIAGAASIQPANLFHWPEGPSMEKQAAP
ncbi:MAG: hypothetical protein AAGD01_10180 [Acidobacteriota bacterium]